jgi:antitoxin MazE
MQTQREEDMMLVKVKKWINSLAVRIPKTFDGEINISKNICADETSLDGSISIKPVEGKYDYRLDDFVDQINKNNLQGEYDPGKPLGKEIW